MGDIALDLFPDHAPNTVNNFVGLARGEREWTDPRTGQKTSRPLYDGTVFHRVIKDFMIQGGDPLGNGTGGPGYQFNDEIHPELAFNEPYLLAMANAGKRMGKGTNGSQFFITVAPTEWLTGKHTIFGKVLEGQDVVNKTKQGDAIKKITIVRNGEDAKKFTASQNDFNKLSAEALKAAAARKEAAFADQIKTIEKNFANFEKNADGIYYKIKKSGSGEKTGRGKKVSVDYKGYLIDGRVFDSSEGRAPLSFTTAAGQMIPGFDAMVQDMKKGESRTIVIPPDLAYGERGYPGVIPENAYIAFDITLH